jgi:rhodanese-related sulfurtransferase
MKHLKGYLLIITALVITACSHAQNGNVLSPKEFQAKLISAKGQLIDVRTPGEFKKGHLKDSRLLNLFDDNFEASLDQLDRNQTYFVYCAVGGRSSEAADLMRKKGFKNVYELDGGFTRWKSEGLPVVL